MIPRRGAKPASTRTIGSAGLQSGASRLLRPLQKTCDAIGSSRVAIVENCARNGVPTGETWRAEHLCLNQGLGAFGALLELPG